MLPDDKSLALNMPVRQTELDRRQPDYMRVKDPAPTVCAAGDAVDLASMTSRFPPTGPKGGAGFHSPLQGPKIDRHKIPEGETPLYSQWRTALRNRGLWREARRHETAEL